MSRAAFKRVTRFDPADLPAAVERLEQNVRTKLEADDVAPAANLYTLPSLKKASYTAKFGELVRCDPTGGAFVVLLPRPDDPKADCIRIANIGTSTNAITVLPAFADTFVNSTVLFQMASAKEAVEFYPDREAKNWIVISGASSGAGMSGVTTQTAPTLNTTVIAITTLALNGHSRSTTGLDLRTKFGGTLHVRLGRGGTTALTIGVKVYVEPLVNNGARVQPFVMFPQLTVVTAANGTTCSAAGNNAGTTTLAVASSASFAADDIICIQDNATPTAGGTEWHRVSRIPAGGVTLELSEPTEFAHNNVAHTVRNKADVQSIPLPGGQAYALIVDYGPSTTGESITVEAIVETLDSLTTV